MKSWGMKCRGMKCRHSLTPIILLCILYITVKNINRLASLYGRPNTSEKQPYITLNSNPSKEKKSLAGPIYIQNGNRIEARQWIVARHLSCYNPLSCFTLFCGVKHDKIKFHEFFCVCNNNVFLSPLSHSLSLSFFPVSLSHSCLPFYLSLTPPLSLFLSVSLCFSHLCLSTYCYLSPALCHSIVLYLIPVSLFLTLLSFFLSFSVTPYVSFSHTCLSLFFPAPIFLSPSIPGLSSYIYIYIYLSLSSMSFFLSFSLALYLPLLFLFLLSLSHPCLSFSLYLWFPLCGSLSLSFSLSSSCLFLFFLSLSPIPVSLSLPPLSLVLSFSLPP